MGEYQANALMDFLPKSLGRLSQLNQDRIEGPEILNEYAEQLKAT